MAAGLLAQHTFAGHHKKKKLALVGTGVRGISFWGKTVREQFGDVAEFVGVADHNPGRLAYGKKFMGVSCPTFTDFDEMMQQTKPDMVLVMTTDSTHHEFIIKSLEYGADVVTEKPMTTDEVKCQAILDAERKHDRQVIVGFNYRHGPHFTKVKELLVKERIGRVVSVDFNWYLNVYHGASYFRRWHGIREFGGTLLVHKSTHHFDLLNWWLDSDPVEVMAYGALDHYGHNNAFRGSNCRGCEYKDKCKFHWDMTGSDHLMRLYADNEKYDGYVRDNCLWRKDIDIWDKMSAQIKYANGVIVNYSLTTYSPFEGFRLAFNGFDGRIETWLDIPWREEDAINQAELHAKEMSQVSGEAVEELKMNEVYVHDNFGDWKIENIFAPRRGHGGGDKRLHNAIFRDPNAPDPYRHMAGTRDGALSILIGIAADKSIQENRPVRIADLTDIDLMPRRPV